MELFWGIDITAITTHNSQSSLTDFLKSLDTELDDVHFQ